MIRTMVPTQPEEQQGGARRGGAGLDGRVLSGPASPRPVPGPLDAVGDPGWTWWTSGSGLTALAGVASLGWVSAGRSARVAGVEVLAGLAGSSGSSGSHWSRRTPPGRAGWVGRRTECRLLGKRKWRASIRKQRDPRGPEL